MAYDEGLALRIATLLRNEKSEFVEKKMFGGIAFMVNDKMCLGVMKDDLMVRVLDDRYELLLKEKYVEPMMFTGRRLHGFLLIKKQGTERDRLLNKWMLYGLEFGKIGVVKSKKK